MTKTNSKYFECSDMKKTHVSTGLFQRARNNETIQELPCLFRRCFPIFTTTEYHGFSLYTVQNEEIQILPPLMHSRPSFFELPRRSPKAKKLPKDRGVYVDLIHAKGAFRVKNQTYAATTTPHRSRLQSYDIHIFIIVLKALFHNMAIALLIERVRTFLYMQ